MATQNETIWDQQWDHFSLPTQNKSFLVLMSPQVAHWVPFFCSIVYQDIYNCVCQNTKKWTYTIHYVKPTAQLLFKFNFQKVDQHAGGKGLIHYNSHSKDNQLQSLKLAYWISKLSC